MTQAPRQLHELHDVYDFLDEIRLRPGIWVRWRSLEHLDSMLIGYHAAMSVHGVDEDFPFRTPGTISPFDQWLCHRNGYESSLGWATQIEREAETAGTPAIELFFSLLDQYRADRRQAAR
ncbi:hypothetical protein [Streptomyces sp. NPDC008141]|uniref:hypothetical protein n=1 Tax=Streptomyces sp. NPDC008141 TaxID=3364815 RepID=UPI0036E8E170